MVRGSSFPAMSSPQLSSNTPDTRSKANANRGHGRTHGQAPALLCVALSRAQQNFPQLPIVPPSLASHMLCPRPRQTADGDGDVTSPRRVN
jgi:hypothetical protein